MKCPFCGQEMEQGKLRSRGGLFFLPEGEGLPKLYTRREMEKHRAVYLPPYALRWWADYPAAQICRSCSKIVVDYNGASVFKYNMQAPAVWFPYGGRYGYVSFFRRA